MYAALLSSEVGRPGLHWASVRLMHSSPLTTLTNRDAHIAAITEMYILIIVKCYAHP